MGAPARVLQVLSSTMRAGVEMMVMNLYREMDKNRVQFDFVAHDLGEDDLGEEIRRLGGRVFRVPLLSKVGIWAFVGIIRGLIEEHGPYAAVHTHTDYQGGFSALAAKQAGVARRICHAHLDTRAIRSPLFLAKKHLGRIFIRRNATQLCACSRYAGIALYGGHTVAKGQVRIINNGIDLTGYAEFDPQAGESLRADCRADSNTRLIGNVARLTPVKNHSFILDMAAEAKAAGLNYRFVIVGSGDLYEELMEKRSRTGLTDTVFFLGTRADVPLLMQSFDAFVLPSHAEGLPLTVVEAQAAGTPVIAAPCVPDEADMGLGLLRKAPVESGVPAWLDCIGNAMEQTIRPDAATRLDAVRRRGFDAKSNVRAVAALYGLDNGRD